MLNRVTKLLQNVPDRVSVNVFPPRYLGVKMYLVRLREPPQPKTDWGVKGVAGLVMGAAGITSPIGSPPTRQRQPQRH